jgi:sugar transferase (PEP-CTERM/EpsH1 system associated)
MINGYHLSRKAVSACAQPPLIVHLIHRLAIGGLENGLLNLIDNMPPERYRHIIVCLTDYTDFRLRLRRDDVPIFALNKRDGQDLPAYLRLYRLLRRLRPDILHTRTWAALDGHLYGLLAGVPGRIHGEHSQHHEPESLRHRVVRKTVECAIHSYTAVSEDAAQWLIRAARIPADRVTRIYNGVNSARFCPGTDRKWVLEEAGFTGPDPFVVGTVGRMQPVKDQLTLVRGFINAVSALPESRTRLRLALIGDGPLRKQCLDLLTGAGLAGLAWSPGERNDIPELLRAMDLFVLPSISEGTSNTILEAMACGVPVLATRVGGNPELVKDGITGALVPASDPAAMAAAIRGYYENRVLAEEHGRAARKDVESSFSLQAMVSGYLRVYDAVFSLRQRPEMNTAGILSSRSREWKS